MTPYEAVFGQKARMGLATKVPLEILEKIMTGTLEEEMLDKLMVPSTTATTPPENRNTNNIEEFDLQTIETFDVEDTQMSNLLEVATDKQNIDIELDEIDELIRDTRTILEIENAIDESSEPTEKRRKMNENSETDSQSIVPAHPAPVKRKLASQNLKLQANRMVNRSNRILPPIKVVDNVLVAIPSVDRGRGDAANLLAVIVEEKIKNFVSLRKKKFSTHGWTGTVWNLRSTVP